MSRRIGELRLYGKGGKVRTVPLKPQLRTTLASWIEQRADPGADGPALFLNRNGGRRLSATAVSDVIATITAAARFEDPATAHVLRHTFGTTLVRAGTDLVTVAELLGHSRIETVRIYSRPTQADKIKALEHLPSTSNHKSVSEIPPVFGLVTRSSTAPRVVGGQRSGVAGQRPNSGGP